MDLNTLPRLLVVAFTSPSDLLDPSYCYRPVLDNYPGLLFPGQLLYRPLSVACRDRTQDPLCIGAVPSHRSPRGPLGTTSRHGQSLPGVDSGEREHPAKGRNREAQKVLWQAGQLSKTLRVPAQPPQAAPECPLLALGSLG